MPVWQTTYIVEKEEMSYKMPGRLLLRSRIWLKTVYNFLYIYISWTSKRRSNLQIFFKLFQYFEICYRKANLATALLTVLTLLIILRMFLKCHTSYYSYCQVRIECYTIRFSNSRLHEKCPYLELFWSAFSCIGTEYGKILPISPYLVQIRGKYGTE